MTHPCYDVLSIEINNKIKGNYMGSIFVKFSL